MCKIGRRIVEFCADESGISSVEYIVLMSIVGAGIVMGMDILGDVVSDRMIRVADCLGGTGGGNGAGNGGGFTGC